ncbi:MAG TPA: zinc ribbon domain-containing protein [Solirubrobacteraceae bacterium]|jgi:hypothetical protein|nr:zinc ribbon domain-containing protein [Solirubrobacteraceae bacterium]
MPPLAYFGIESNTFTTVIDLLIVVVVVIYLSLIYWTYADARRRIADPMLIGCATAASFFPFVGTLVYMILRPPEYLEDVQERELEIQAAEARLNSVERRLCPQCDYPIERDFIRCPSCLRKLKERCVSCSRPLDRAWTICPYCETEVPPGATPKRRTRRRAAAASADAPLSPDGEELTMAPSAPEAPTAVVTSEPASRRAARAPVARPRPSGAGGEDLV